MFSSKLQFFTYDYFQNFINFLKSFIFGSLFFFHSKENLIFSIAISVKLYCLKNCECLLDRILFEKSCIIWIRGPETRSKSSSLHLCIVNFSPNFRSAFSRQWLEIQVLPIIGLSEIFKVFQGIFKPWIRIVTFFQVMTYSRISISKKLPRWTFCDAILWMKNSARKKFRAHLNGWKAGLVCHNRPDSRSEILFWLEKTKTKIVFRARHKMSTEVTF